MHPAVDSTAADPPKSDAPNHPPPEPTPHTPAPAAASPPPATDEAAQEQEQAQEQAQAQADPPPPPPPAPAQKSVTWSSDLTSEAPPPAAAAAAAAAAEASPYVSRGPVNSSSSKSTVDAVKETLGKWGKTVGETTKMVGSLSRDTWQHLKTGPSFAEAAMGRLAQGTKVIAEGGYDKIFRQTFEALPEERLRISYACYLSTSAGPVMGVLYISTAKIAFCSDNPLSYKAGNKTEWSYYKVVIPLHQLRAANPSVSKANPAEKYVQVVSVDGHEFWFMGFLRYESAVTSLQEALASARDLHP